MSTTFRRTGNTRQHTPSGADVASGEVVGPIGTANVFGIAVAAIADGATGALLTSGVHELTALGTDVWADGDTLYWDAGADNLTDVSAGNQVIGIAEGAKASTVVTAQVLINSNPSS